MYYCIKCTECDYAAEVSVSGWSEFEKFKEENKCPECESKLETDIAQQGKGMSFRIAASGTTYSKQSKRLERANKRRNDKVVHEKNIKKDPYYQFREKGDPRKVI